jgi:hypothetical protein
VIFSWRRYPDRVNDSKKKSIKERVTLVYLFSTLQRPSLCGKEFSFSILLPRFVAEWNPHLIGQKANSGQDGS